MGAIPTPNADDLRLAALWCDNYESSEVAGNTDDAAPFKRVARWLEQQAEAKELREAAKEHGVPVGKLRAALTRAE